MDCFQPVAVRLHESVTCDAAARVDAENQHPSAGQRFHNFIGDDSDPLNTIQFMDNAKDNLAVFEKITLSREKVSTIKCYLTGEKAEDDQFNISRYIIEDKHEFRHVVYNAKVNIYRQRGVPIYLGRQASDLDDFQIVNRADLNPALPTSEVVDFPINKKNKVY